MTIDELDRVRKWLHNHQIIEMSWIPTNSQQLEHWEWQPREYFTIYFLYFGAAIVLALFTWVYG